VGYPNLQREVARARNAYLGAVRRWNRAGEAFAAAAGPLLPDDTGPSAQWSREQIAIMRACALAWSDLVAARRDYNAAVADLRANDPGPNCG
jgi:hypothetical protein